MAFFALIDEPVAIVVCCDTCGDACCDGCCTCFVPVDKALYMAIHEEGKKAELDRLKVVKGEGERTKRMSKTRDNAILCPPSGLPSDTILSKQAQGHEQFSVLTDQRPPFIGSMGPNIVLCNPKIMNIFSLDPAAYSRMRRDFYEFRATHIDEILRAYATTIDEQVTKPDFVELYGENIRVALERFKHVLEVIIGKMTRKINKDEFAQTGLTLSSYCQTWMRNGAAQANAEFSVMSPHFQTKLNIEDRAALFAYVGRHHITDADLDCLEKAQLTTLEGYLDLDRGEKSARGFADYTGAFVDLDRSWSGM
jgi:hypothetical protein